MSERQQQRAAAAAAELTNPDVPLITRAYMDKFLCPADDKLGQRPCCCGNNCVAFQISSTEADLCCSVDPSEKRPLREFVFPGPNGLEDTHTATDAAMCILCLMHSTAVHVCMYMSRREEPKDLLQMFRVDVTTPGEFAIEDCWALRANDALTGVAYPIPHFVTSRFKWTAVRQPERQVRVANLFPLRPAA